MKWLSFIRTTFFLFFVTLFITAHSQPIERDMTGNWKGILDINGTELPLITDISKDVSGAYTGVLHSPNQGASNIPITRITVKTDSITILVSSLILTIQGQLMPGDTILDCIFRQGPLELPFIMKRGSEPFSYERPQEPKPPFPYIIQEVTYLNKKDNIQLGGTLTLPDKSKKHPAVILISGSGSQNRDEEIMGHKPFWVIADFLSRNGIAVLRFDDRGVDSSEGDPATSTSEDFKNDVAAGVQYLRTHPYIDNRNIGLIGHSEGGLIAPMLASEDSAIAFVIMLAGPGIKGEEVIKTQVQKIQLLSGQKRAIVRRIAKDISVAMEILQQEPDTARASIALREYYNRRAEKIPEAYQSLFGYDRDSREATIKAYNSLWFRYFIASEPEDFLKNVDVPVLALFGEKDVQVLPKINSKGIEKIARKYKKDHFIVKVYPERNHLFQKAETGLVNEYAIITETIGEEVLKDITQFIQKNLRD